MFITHAHQESKATQFSMRPVQVGDADGLKELIRSLPAHERRWRFHGSMARVPELMLRRFTSFDLTRQVAYVVHAQCPGGPELIADGRLIIQAYTASADMAVMVAPAWRRKGIGRMLVTRLLRAAAQAGVHTLNAEVMVENIAMQTLLRDIGFRPVARSVSAGTVQFAAPVRTRSRLRSALEKTHLLGFVPPQWWQLLRATP
jgi:acetyltransferase